MKKGWMIWLVTGILLLSGCSEPVYETVADEPAVPAVAQSRQILVSLPENAAVPTVEQTGVGNIYECDGFTLTIQTMDAGDLDKTLQTLTGYRRADLQVIESVKDGFKRYDSVFTAAGEGALQVGRVCILDDGAYHYAVTTMAPENTAGQLQSAWEDIFGTFRLVDGNVDLNTGS